MRPVFALLLCLLCRVSAEAGEFPTVSPMTTYAARAGTENAAYEAILRLRGDNFFVLHQRESIPGKKASETSLTGTWRQIAEGGILQLSNRHGLLLRLNVGGGGNLYGDLRAPASGLPVSLMFQKTRDQARPFTLEGTLSRDAGAVSLRDSASGRAFAIVQGDAPRDGDALFVEALVEETEHGLRLLRLHGVASRAPLADEGAAAFENIAPGRAWGLWAEGLPRLSCAFDTPRNGRGALEIAARGLRLRAEYRVKADALALRVHPEDAAMLKAVGADDVLDLLENVRRWALEGKALVLFSGSAALAVLEQRVPASRMPERTAWSMGADRTWP